MLKRVKSLGITLLLLSSLAFAADGASIFKTKCAGCHGPNGEGKVGPSLKATKLGEDDIVMLLSKGEEKRKAPHKKSISGLSEEDVKAVAHYVKSLQ
jgi:mono/diheme cytochrome c family protein